MKKLLPTLSLPIGIIFLAFLALFPSQRDLMVNKKEEEQMHQKEEEKDPLIIKEVRVTDSLKRTRKSVLKSYVVQQLKDWNCLMRSKEK